MGSTGLTMNDPVFGVFIDLSSLEQDLASFHGVYLVSSAQYLSGRHFTWFYRVLCVWAMDDWLRCGRPRVGPGDPVGAVPLAPPAGARAAEPGAGLEPRRHRPLRDLRLRPGMARGSPRGAFFILSPFLMVFRFEPGVLPKFDGLT